MLVAGEEPSETGEKEEDGVDADKDEDDDRSRIPKSKLPNGMRKQFSMYSSRASASQSWP